MDSRDVAAIFDRDRFKVARLRRGSSKKVVAEHVGVSPAAVGQWERGVSRPKPQTLERLAEHLEFPVSFFAAGATDLRPLDERQSFFRSLRRTSKAKRNKAMASAALVANLIEVLERHVRLPEVYVPQHPIPVDAEPKAADDAAKAVRAAWSLGSGPVENVVREMERHGIVVVRLALADHSEIDAFSWPGKVGADSRRPLVMLGTEKGDRARSRFDAAHELGHLVMHAQHPAPADQRLERQAHRFASTFLLPPGAYEDEWPTSRLRWPDLIALKRRWHVSLAALLYRAQADGLLSGANYQSAVKYMSRAGWRSDEPGDLGGVEQPRLLRRVFEALREQGVGVADIANEAHLPHHLIEGLASENDSSRVAVRL